MMGPDFGANMPDMKWLPAILFLAAIGFLALAFGFGAAFWYFVFSHIQWH